MFKSRKWFLFFFFFFFESFSKKPCDHQHRFVSDAFKYVQCILKIMSKGKNDLFGMHI